MSRSWHAANGGKALQDTKAAALREARREANAEAKKQHADGKNFDAANRRVRKAEKRSSNQYTTNIGTALASCRGEKTEHVKGRRRRGAR